MYDELVKTLRVCGDSNNSCENCPVRENDGGCPHGGWEFAAEKYMLQAADAIESMCEMVSTAYCENANIIASYEESKPRWIPVTERLPSEPGSYLVFVLSKRNDDVSWIDIDYFNGERFCGGQWDTGRPQAWMLLPEPPHSEFYESLKTALEQAINGETRSYTLVQALEDAGAEVKPGTGKMFCNGQEVDPKEVFENCFQPPKEETE